MPRRARVGAALGASLIVLAGILVVALYVPYRLNESANQRYVEEVIPLRALVQQLAIEVATRQADAEEFLLTRDEDAQRAYDRGQTRVNRTLSDLVPHQEREPSLAELLQEATLEIVQVQGALE